MLAQFRNGVTLILSYAGPPTSDTWALGDIVQDSTGIIWRCSVAGSPGTWVELGAQPAGMLADFAGTTPPVGWLLCDGAAVSRTTYPKLFAAIGVTWGNGDGITTFNLPDLRRRTTIGSGGTAVSGPSNEVGSVGGEEKHTLTADEIPAHSHAINASHTATSVALWQDPHMAVIDTEGTATFRGSAGLQQTGGGQAHNVMQPSAVVLKIIKT